jgi:Tfp pilus assembly protein PilO
MKLSKAKRSQLVIVFVVTVAILALIGFGLIRSQYSSLSKIEREKADADRQLQSVKKAINDADPVAMELAETTTALQHAEEDMASGDLYSWTYDTIRHFKQQYKVEIPDIGHPVIGNVELLPSFPYKQIQFSITGTAYYHDLGKFIADFENFFPHSRMVNLMIETTTGDNTEKLAFRMDIISLVKLNPS